MKTLLIDDDLFTLKLLGRQLELLGCDAVALYKHAQDAIALLEADAESVDLVFCDLQMPNIDGVEFIRHLERIAYRGSLVLISGEDERILQTVQKLAQAHHIRVLGALRKPISTAQLSQILASNVPRIIASSRVARQPFSPDELKRAIASAELVNHYQPKVDLATGEFVGVETLVRWQHSQAGLVYPDQFISLAEEHGLIDELTRTVLAAALCQARLWKDAGLDLQLAVNISMDNLEDLDFPDVIAQLASEAQIELSSLILEVTESRLMKDLRGPLDILTRLRLKRVTLSIDDFGTGHSSLAQLRDIPFNELKLDRGFVSGAARDASLGAIVEGTLAIAHQLGMKSVAEGVEDRLDWDFMRALGCNVAQGYFIGRPMPGEKLQGWRDNWESRRRDLTEVIGS